MLVPEHTWFRAVLGRLEFSRRVLGVGDNIDILRVLYVDDISFIRPTPSRHFNLVLATYHFLDGEVLDHLFTRRVNALWPAESHDSENVTGGVRSDVRLSLISQIAFCKAKRSIAIAESGSGNQCRSEQE